MIGVAPGFATWPNDRPWPLDHGLKFNTDTRLLAVYYTACTRPITHRGMRSKPSVPVVRVVGRESPRAVLRSSPTAFRRR